MDLIINGPMGLSMGSNRIFMGYDWNSSGNISDRYDLATQITHFWTVQDGCSRQHTPLQANIRSCDRPAQSSRETCFQVREQADRGW